MFLLIYFPDVYLLDDISKMSKAKAKWYVVLKGKVPGIYTNWDDAKRNVHDFPGAVYKSFESESVAIQAWTEKRFPPKSPEFFSENSSTSHKGKISDLSHTRPKGSFVIVDAACAGVPGPTEYQGFLMPEKKLLFSMHIGLATNNIGEFLAIVHALALLKSQNSELPIYSDSETALSWVRKRKIGSKLERTAKTQRAWELSDRAIAWLNSNSYPNKVYKWVTEHWGENPADYGRK